MAEARREVTKPPLVKITSEPASFHEGFEKGGNLKGFQVGTNQTIHQTCVEGEHAFSKFATIIYKQKSF